MAWATHVMATSTDRADVVVIGAGLAGLSAAVRLASAGCTVVVCEEGPRLGGRASAFTDRESGERIDNGQHALFGCYRETYAFLRAIGTDHLAPLQSRLDVTMAAAGGRSGRLACPRWPPPWHLVGAVLRWPALPVRDRLGAVRLRGFLSDVRRRGAEAAASAVPADQTVTDWLVRHGQSPALRAWLWNPLAIAALNQSPDTAAAAPFVRVLGELFGPRAEDSAIAVPTVPLDELYAEPARAFVEARGGRVLLKTPARVRVGAGGAIAGVAAGGENIETRVVISSVPWHALGRIWDGEPPRAMATILERAAATRSSPIVTVNLWSDGAGLGRPFVGLVGGPMHWVFDKRAVFGSRARHLSIVASGAEDLVAIDNAAITALAARQIADTLPDLVPGRIDRSVVVREHRATFSLAPGAPPRPDPATPISGFWLAGDWTNTGLPGTIESAVVSGHRAADGALAVNRQSIVNPRSSIFNAGFTIVSSRCHR
ncbi:MAG TPA: hydroxysqualene dehydroxylase HpnE [Vicinamibacterales bacterium]|nr:hydroxysqualene dehydroxylase HpnE [Vicinamibacterales bacterium]